MRIKSRHPLVQIRVRYVWLVYVHSFVAAASRVCWVVGETASRAAETAAAVPPSCYTRRRRAHVSLDRGGGAAAVGGRGRRLLPLVSLSSRARPRWNPPTVAAGPLAFSPTTLTQAAFSSTPQTPLVPPPLPRQLRSPLRPHHRELQSRGATRRDGEPPATTSTSRGPAGDGWAAVVECLAVSDHWWCFY